MCIYTYTHTHIYIYIYIYIIHLIVNGDDWVLGAELDAGADHAVELVLHLGVTALNKQKKQHRWIRRVNVNTKQHR